MNKYIQFIALSLATLSFSLPSHAAECSATEKLKLLRSGVSDAEIKNLCEDVPAEKKDQAQTDKQAPIVVNVNQNNNQNVNQTQNNNQTNNASSSNVNLPSPKQEYFFWEVGIGYARGGPTFNYLTFEIGSTDLTFGESEHVNNGLAYRLFPLTYFPNSIRTDSLGFGIEIAPDTGEHKDSDDFTSAYDNWSVSQTILSVHYVLNNKPNGFYLIPYFGYGSGTITRDFSTRTSEVSLYGMMDGSISSMNFGLRLVNDSIHENGSAFAVNLRYTSYSDSKLSGNFTLSSYALPNDVSLPTKSEVDGFSVLQLTASYLW